MHSRAVQWTLLALFAAILMGTLSGCATQQDYSDQPWNEPQPWEGVLPMPGMDNQNSF